MKKSLSLAILALHLIHYSSPASELSDNLPPLPERPPAIFFGTTDYKIEGRNLILQADENRCKEIISTLSRMPYILNGKGQRKTCKIDNVITIPNFFLPDLLTRH